MNGSGLQQWFQERFPPINFVSGIFLYLLPKSLACIWVAAIAGAALPWSLRDVFAALVPALHLFLLRVFDEHKDFESDKIFNPHRVLQRGVVSLREIRRVGWAAAVLQIICFLATSPSKEALIAFIAVWIWTLLMWKEFFIKDWLKKNYFFYSLLHLLISPALLLLGLEMAGAPDEWMLDLFLLGLMTSWIYEVSRKTKGPEEETGDISFSKMWGVRRCCTVIAIQGLLCLLVGAHLFQMINILHEVAIGTFVVVLALHSLSVMKFARHPSAKARKSNEGTSALIGLVIFIIPLILAIRLNFR
jgi:4-hydroxybenzoate polyprenyltransferase